VIYQRALGYQTSFRERPAFYDAGLGATAGQDGSGGVSLLAQATAFLGGVQPLHYWDFISDRALFNGQDVGALSNTPGWSFTRATVGSALTAAGAVTQFALGQLRRTDRGALIEGARTNLFLNSDVGVTQNVTVAAVSHVLSFRGTGTITLTGVSTAGPLVGTGVSNLVTLAFTPSAGVLTLTVTGSCTNVQLEEGAFASSWIPTAGVIVVRNADILRSTAGVAYPLGIFAEINRAVDTAGVETYAATDTNNGTDDNRASIGVGTTDLGRGNMTAGGVLQGAITAGSAIAVGTTAKIAGCYATNRVQVCSGGTLGTEDTVATAPTNPTTVQFGANGSGSSPGFGYIRKVAVFNFAPTDAQLQAMTL